MTNRDDPIVEDREFTEEELERYFQEAEEEEPAPRPFIQTPRFRKIVLVAVAIVLLVQVISFFPQLFSLEAMRFLTTSARLSQSAHIQTYKESVVVIHTDGSQGTGFMISPDGLIVTNRHVVEGSTQLRVSLASGEQFIGRIVKISDEVDLALVDIDAEHLPVLPLAHSYTGEAGIPVYIIGNPLFFTGIANEGQTYGVTHKEPQMLVLQAPVYKGNSGSPVIAEHGEVIGVVFATSSARIDGEERSVGLAVPVQWVHRLLEEVDGLESSG